MAIFGVDITILGVDIPILGVNIPILMRQEQRGGYRERGEGGISHIRRLVAGWSAREFGDTNKPQRAWSAVS